MKGCTRAPSSYTAYTSRTRSKPLISPVAAVVGVVFLLVGALGFVPGVTTDYDQLMLAGHESGAELLGLFEVSVLHNIVHLLGVTGLVLARTAVGARSYLIGGGVVYLLLWIYGLLIDLDSDANVVAFNDADNWLHLGLGGAMVGLGAALTGSSSGPAPT